MVSVGREIKKVLQSSNQVAKSMTAIYKIINGMKKVDWCGYLQFHINTVQKEPSKIRSQLA